jgi:hypothetical protein
MVTEDPRPKIGEEETLRIIREYIAQHTCEVMEGVSTLFTPEVMAEVQEIKRKHAEEWERVKNIQFTI